ncbi:AAA family ATPase [soil metagenome]
MTLTEREHELDQLAARAAAAHGGRGGAVMVCGESGAGKTSFVEAVANRYIERFGDRCRVLWGACDPLSTPRPLGPLHDLAHEFSTATHDLLGNGEQPYDIFASVFADLKTRPSILVLDDLHWADQGTIDLLRFLLRRARNTQLLTIGIARDDEVGVTHPLRGLLGDVARSPHAHCLILPPLSVQAVSTLVGDRDVDPIWLHRMTGGNAFFVCEMLDHSHEGAELPTTVRDAILARTANLDVAAWDLLNLLTCAPGSIPDHLLAALGVTVDALRTLDDAKLIKRDARGLTFRHDLCRRAVTSVIPPGAEPTLHRRFIDAHHTVSNTDPAVLTHHALGAGDAALITSAGVDAGRAAARSGAHTQACEFFEIALAHGNPQSGAVAAELLELLAAEYYLTDRLDDAIVACGRAMGIRQELGAPLQVSADHHSLAVYQWYNGNRALADDHVAEAITVLDGGPCEQPALVLLGHAFCMQAFLAVQSSRLDHARQLVTRAREIASAAADPTLTVRVRLIGYYCDIAAGDDVVRDDLLAVLAAGPRHIDETYSGGYTNLTYFDVEQRRLGVAAELLETSIPLMIEHDLPICRVVQLGSRSRLNLLVGDWDDALADADAVLDSPSAPLARTWPLLIRGVVSLRRTGDDAGGIDEAWRLACRFGELVRVLPAAAAIVERSWLTGTVDPRVDECRSLLDSAPVTGLEWARGELAMWLRRLDATVAADGMAEPYRLLADGRYEAAADAFHRRSTPYDAALALVDSGDPKLARRGLDVLDRLGADAVAAKVRFDLRAAGTQTVPAPRRATTRANPAGLTTRQVEVLRLLDDGLTNAELAERLYLSVKTVDHHVSAILAKLDVTKRRDAVRRAREVGILA